MSAPPSLGGGDLSVTAAPELERRIAALVSSGEEDVSFSQVQGRLQEWLNRRRVNRSVGQIPRLEGELEQVRDALTALEEVTARLGPAGGRRGPRWRGRRRSWRQELELHRRLARRDLDRRYAQAGEELAQAQKPADRPGGEAAKMGPIPDRER